MGVIPVPPATIPIASCLKSVTRKTIHSRGREKRDEIRITRGVLIFFPFVFRDGTANGEALSDVHVVHVSTHRPIGIFLDE